MEQCYRMELHQFGVSVDMSNTETATPRVAVGICPTHDYVYGEDVEYKFPNPCYCRCGEELERVTVASQEEIRDALFEKEFQP